MPSRLTFLFQLTTEPLSAQFARPHTAGWSESLWRLDQSTSVETITQLAYARAVALPTQGSIIGYRQQVYTLDGNKLVPGGARTGNLNAPGRPTQECDQPQVALEIKLASAGKANIGKMVLRGIPDNQASNGEYRPQAAFDLVISRWIALLTQTQCQFLGRDLTMATQRVVSITGGVLTTGASLGAAVGDYVRLLRVRDTFGRPVTGVFRVTAVAGFAYTLAGLDPDIVVNAVGSARKDLLALFPITSGETGRIRVKKVGRPFEGYRGRASKRRAG